MLRPRVLVVDDAVVVRRIVTDALNSDPGLEVVGTASNGRIALAKIPQLNPDIITLDVEMPEMDGLETLVEIRKLYPRLPVIMFSTLTDRGASVTMDALFKGANDYVTKPANVGSVGEAIERIRQELLPKVHALCGRRPGGSPEPSGPRVSGPRRPVGERTRPLSVIRAVVIGVSTGGPNALAELVPALPGDLQVPVLIVQHMPPMFTRLLAERLNDHSPLDVHEAVDGEPIVAGSVYVAPGDHHLEVRRGGGTTTVGTTRGPLENSCRPSADVLFRTAAEVYGAGVLGVVLTGMGSDAKHGAEHIHEVGGQIVSQDQDTSVVWGMPRAVYEAGTTDEVLPLAAIAGAIRTRVAHGRASAATCVGARG